MVGLVHRWSSPGVVHVTHTTYTTHHVHHGGHWAAGPDPNSIIFILFNLVVTVVQSGKAGNGTFACVVNL